MRPYCTVHLDICFPDTTHCFDHCYYSACCPSFLSLFQPLIVVSSGHHVVIEVHVSKPTFCAALPYYTPSTVLLLRKDSARTKRCTKRSAPYSSSKLHYNPSQGRHVASCISKRVAFAIILKNKGVKRFQHVLRLPLRLEIPGLPTVSTPSRRIRSSGREPIIVLNKRTFRVQISTPSQLL